MKKVIFLFWFFSLGAQAEIYSCKLSGGDNDMPPRDVVLSVYAEEYVLTLSERPTLAFSNVAFSGLVRQGEFKIGSRSLKAVITTNDSVRVSGVAFDSHAPHVFTIYNDVMTYFDPFWMSSRGLEEEGPLRGICK